VLPSEAARSVQLLLLTIVAMAGIYARNALGPLQESMRVALALSDNEMALLQGPALALPLLIAAIPLGLLVDRYSRVHLLVLSTAINIVGTIAGTLTSSFGMLFAARSLVGLGSPATAIAAYSLLADLYPPSARGRATMFVLLGQVAGASAAFALGGELLVVFGSENAAWRPAMFWMGGVLAPILVLALALREPLRSGRAVDNPSLRMVPHSFGPHQHLRAPSVFLLNVSARSWQPCFWSAVCLDRFWAAF
jgi:MFS family permease